MSKLEELLVSEKGFLMVTIEEAHQILREVPSRVVLSGGDNWEPGALYELAYKGQLVEVDLIQYDWVVGTPESERRYALTIEKPKMKFVKKLRPTISAPAEISEVEKTIKEADYCFLENKKGSTVVVVINHSPTAIATEEVEIVFTTTSSQAPVLAWIKNALGKTVYTKA